MPWRGGRENRASLSPPQRRGEPPSRCAEAISLRRVATFDGDPPLIERSFQLPFGASDQNYNTQLWTIAMEGPPRMDRAYPESAVFSATASSTSNGLVLNGKSLVLGSEASWTIEQMPMAMAGLSVENIKLHTVPRGQSFLPTLILDGSAPRAWSIEPALPSFLTFDPTSGRISQTRTT